MTRIWVNLALIFGTLGFVGVLLVILAGFLGCCAGITTIAYQKILLVILGAAVVAFAWCMYHNCRKSPEA